MSALLIYRRASARSAARGQQHIPPSDFVCCTLAAVTGSRPTDGAQTNHTQALTRLCDRAGKLRYIRTHVRIRIKMLLQKPPSEQESATTLFFQYARARIIAVVPIPDPLTTRQ